MKPWICIFVSLALVGVLEAGPMKKRNQGAFSELEANLTALWTKVNRMATGVQIHLHGMDDAEPHMDNQADGTHVHLHMHMGHGDRHGGDKHRNLKDDHENEYHYGICQVVSNAALPGEEQQPITGNLYFRQMHGEHLEIKVHLEGFDMSGEHASHLHGLHVHEYGDMSDGCNSLGSHFDPNNNQEHGGPHKETRHCGDYGNIKCDEEGVVHRTFMDDHTALEGPYSILGRSIVIHENADDLGSEVDASGGAGKRLACCVVVGSKDLDWDTIHGEHEAMVVVEEHQHKDMSHSHHKDHRSNDDTHHGYHAGHEDHKGHEHESHPYHPGHENHEGHVHPEEHDPNHEGHADHVGHAHENHPDHPGHENHEGHVHPEEHDHNHEGHADHVGHTHENHPDHPGHEKHEGHVHSEEHDHNHEGKRGKKRDRKGKKKGRRNKQS